MRIYTYILVVTCLLVQSSCNTDQSSDNFSSGFYPDLVEKVELQPLAKHVKRLIRKLDYLGSPLSDETVSQLNEVLVDENDNQATIKIQNILDKFCLASVMINPESRVKTKQGPAPAKLYQNQPQRFLVKIINEAGVTSGLRLVSDESTHTNKETDHSHAQNTASNKDLFQFRVYMPGGSWLNSPSKSKLTGLEVNYAVLFITCGETGKREATLSFDVGQGTQDIGFRGDLPILFSSLPTFPMEISQITDETGEDLMAGLIIKNEDKQVFPGQTSRISPDLWFQPQVYRTSGDVIQLPEGSYTITCLRGPEYIPQTQQVKIIDKGTSISFKIKRWIDPSEYHYWSGDHHIHAAGCAHYVDPLEGVLPEAMYRYIQGEDLKVGSVLTWGPGFDYQKQFFTGMADTISEYPYTLRYDVEVSGFGSHVSGHLVLLRLQDQIYPGGDSKDHWPTLGLNTLRWAKKQGAITGPAHSGLGINTFNPKLPNYEIPPYNSIGANEYIVDITHKVEGPDGKMVPAIDFISSGDTWPIAELNMWYHTLNCGFSTRISGETDFPCITGARVGVWRSYVRQEGTLDYDRWCLGIQEGKNYVSDGLSHLMDLTVGNALMGEGNGEHRIKKPGNVKVTVKAAALLSTEEQQTIERLFIGDGSPDDLIPWGIENAKKGDSQEVVLEIIKNGYAIDSVRLVADGQVRTFDFDIPLDQSSWIAARIFPSSHTNPVFVIVNNMPIRASKKSAEWCRQGVDQCWEEKEKSYHEDEVVEAGIAYDHARKVYDRIIAESKVD